MAAYTATVTVQTRGDNDIIDLTGDLHDAAASSGIRDGTVTAFVPGSTAGITVTELEPGLRTDTDEALERLVPRAHPYAHNHGGDSNGHAHIRASLVGPGITVPLVNGALTLGTWQQVVLIDFDERPRRREIVIQVVG